MNLLKELKWRNFIFNYTKKIKKNNNIILYIGYDPSYNSLHIGHLLSFFLLKIFIKYYKKIKIFILIGEYTAKINFIKNIKYNIKCIKKQILKIINKLNIKKNIIIFLNNNKWYKKIKLINFFQKICKNIKLNYLINKIKIKNNINKNINLLKLIYPIIQANDYLILKKKYKCNLQIGGSDQWGNITLGIKLIKKILKKNVYGLTFPLLTDNKNNKFSKSKNYKNIWLNKKKNTPFFIYQYFLNFNDNNCIKFIKYCSIIKIKNIKKILNNFYKNKKKKNIHKKISKIIIKIIYSNKEYKYSKYLSKYLFNYNNNFLKLKNYLNFLKENIIYFYIKKKYIFNIKKLIKKINIFLKISITKIKNLLYNNIIKFNFKKYNNFIKNNNKKYIICKIKKFFFLIKLI